VALKEVEGPPGPPWNRRLQGRLDSLVVDSDLLAGNPLGDPARRPLYVYLPRSISESGQYAAVYVIQGFTGQLDMWLNRFPFEPTMVERLDDLSETGDLPPAVIVFVDAWTSYGGSQFINSASTVLYMDYLCDEVVPFVDNAYPTAASREHRGLTGKSSGGYGAMVVPMLQPDVFGALASHAGKADEWYLDLGARAFGKELDALGVEYTLDLFEGTHIGIQYCYPGAIAELARGLSP
jgi:enterochelin esterase-like enzyme